MQWLELQHRQAAHAGAGQGVGNRHVPVIAGCDDLGDQLILAWQVRQGFYFICAQQFAITADSTLRTPDWGSFCECAQTLAGATSYFAVEGVQKACLRDSYQCLSGCRCFECLDDQAVLDDLNLSAVARASRRSPAKLDSRALIFILKTSAVH